VSRWVNFQLLAGLLRGVLDRETPEPPHDIATWQTLFAAASSHMVTPALAWSLRGRTDLPEDVSDYLDAVLYLNRERNQLIVEALGLALEALAAADIRPVLLKGAGMITQDFYPDPGIRVVGDLDLLVGEAQLPRASAALTKAGFLGDPNSLAKGPAHHHAPVQVHIQTGVGVELHRRVLHKKGLGLIGTEQFMADSELVTALGRPALLPTVTDRVIHSIAHAQIVDGHHHHGVPHLRQLLDLELLIARHGPDIQWGDVEDRFAVAGRGQVVVDTRLQARFLFGETTLDPAEAAVAIRMKQALIRPQVMRLADALSLNVQEQVAVFRVRPRRILRLFSATHWHALLDDWRKQLLARSRPW
jgi:hypothetical protein